MKMALLRWSISLALGAPAVTLAVSSRAIPLMAIGATEAMGAVLLQPRQTRVAGAVLLAASLLAASAFHALSGERPPLAFLVYFAALGVVVKPC